jgi:class 3 adenylate cyclase
VKTIGDAVTFATPDRAIAAAIRMREAMDDLGAQRQHRSLLLKMGIHEGPCLAVTTKDECMAAVIAISDRLTQTELLTVKPPFGRPAKLNARQRQLAAERYTAGQTMATIAQELDVSEATISRVLNAR